MEWKPLSFFVSHTDLGQWLRRWLAYLVNSSFGYKTIKHHHISSKVQIFEPNPAWIGRFRRCHVLVPQESRVSPPLPSAQLRYGHPRTWWTRRKCRNSSRSWKASFWPNARAKWQKHIYMWCWARYRVLFYMRFLFLMNCDRSGHMLDLQDRWLLCVDGSKKLVLFGEDFRNEQEHSYWTAIEQFQGTWRRTLQDSALRIRRLSFSRSSPCDSSAAAQETSLRFRDRNSYWNIWNAQTDTRWYKHIEAQWDFRFSVTSNLVSTEVSETIGFCSRWKTIKPDA